MFLVVVDVVVVVVVVVVNSAFPASDFSATMLTECEPGMCSHTVMLNDAEEPGKRALQQ